MNLVEEFNAYRASVAMFREASSHLEGPVGRGIRVVATELFGFSTYTWDRLIEGKTPERIIATAEKAIEIYRAAR